MLALFGNSSFFWAVQHATESNYTDVLRNVCSGSVPFPKAIPSFTDYGSLSLVQACAYVNLGPGYGPPETSLTNLMASFVGMFANANVARAVLGTAMFAANEALLTTTGAQGWLSFSRSIYSSAGYEIEKPVKSIAAIVVVSVLLLVQVAGVVALAAYNASFPTWTTTLDALAMAKIGRELQDNGGLVPLGVRDEHGLRFVANGPEGVIGVVEGDADSTADDKTPPAHALGLGAPGVITRATASGKLESKV